MSFKESISHIEMLIEALPLNVLIWGPGLGGGEHFEKRLKIRSEIETHFKHAEVRFSEDLETAVAGYADLNVVEQERWHLAACDLCVVLDTSKGAGEEIAHFATSRFGTKLLILTHKRYEGVSSFPTFIRQYGHQLFYGDEEYVDCSLVERVLTRLRQVGLEKLGGLL